MIDTLRLNLVDCEIKRSTPLTVMPGFLDYSTGKIHNEHDLFIDNTGRIVRGSKAFLNDDKFNLTIQPSISSELNSYNRSKLKIKRFKRIAEDIQPDLYDYNSDDEVTGTFLQTSLPRVINETNFKTLTLDEQKTALKELQHKLRTYGIKTNIFNAVLSRVDTFTNLKTELPFFSYSKILDLLECSRMKSVGYAEESYLWKNGNQQIAVYDKIREMAQKDNEFFLNERKKALSNKNIMRIENRLLKKRSIKDRLNLLTVDDLYKNYSDVKEYHTNEIKTRIFKYNDSEFTGLVCDNIKRRLIYARKIFGAKKWFSQYCFYNGLNELALNIDVEYIGKMIDIIDIDGSDVKKRVKKSRIKKQFENAKIYFGNNGMFEKINTRSYLDLYNELKTKFYKEVA